MFGKIPRRVAGIALEGSCATKRSTPSGLAGLNHWKYHTFVTQAVLHWYSFHSGDLPNIFRRGHQRISIFLGAILPNSRRGFGSPNGIASSWGTTATKKLYSSSLPAAPLQERRVTTARQHSTLQRRMDNRGSHRCFPRAVKDRTGRQAGVRSSASRRE